jgi:hypothetical protein
MSPASETSVPSAQPQAQAPGPPAPVLAGTPGAQAPLTAEHYQQLQQADLRARKIRSAARMALFNGITLGIFAGAALLFAAASPLFGQFDVTALVMGIALGLVTWNELRGRRLLRRFDPRAPAVLGWNQLALMALLIAYCAWMIAKSLLGRNPYAEAIAAEPLLGSMLEPVGRLYKLLTLALYGGIIVGTVIFQGLNAAYYFTRRKHLDAYLAETPPWVIELQRHSQR